MIEVSLQTAASLWRGEIRTEGRAEDQINSHRVYAARRAIRSRHSTRLGLRWVPDPTPHVGGPESVRPGMMADGLVDTEFSEYFSGLKDREIIEMVLWRGIRAILAEPEGQTGIARIDKRALLPLDVS